MLSQFTWNQSLLAGQEKKRTLKDYTELPNDVYPVGRLDYDSEGLLILTNDTGLNNRLLNPAHAHQRTYWVQVEGLVDERGLAMLRSGIEITIDGRSHISARAIAEKFETDPHVHVRNPPIRFRKNIPTCWIKLILTEGKNRQVRKMTAKAGYPTLRLIRYAIGNLTIDGLRPGDLRELGKNELYRLLFE